MKLWRKTISLLLAAVMLLAACPLSASAASPTISVSPESVKINLAESKSAVVKISYSNLPDGCYISLSAAGPFICEWNEDNSFTINATGTGSADLDVMACRESDDSVVAKKTIRVTVVDEPANTGTVNTAALAKLNDYYDKQAYSVKKVEYYTDKARTDKKVAYQYVGGICNVNAYVTLLNRYLAAHFGNDKCPVTVEDALSLMGLSYSKIFFERKNKANTTKEVTAVGNYTVNGETKKKSGTTKLTVLTEKKEGANSYIRRGYSNSGSTLRFYKDPDKYYYSYSSHNIKAKKISGKQTPASLAKLLKEHPEGVYVHASRYKLDEKGNKIKEAEHTVVVISGSESNGSYTFRVSDPVYGCYDKKNMKNSSSVLMKTNSHTFGEIDFVVVLYEK